MEKGDKLKLLKKIHAISIACESFERNERADIKTKSGGGFSYSYATLDQIQKVLKPLCKSNDILVMFNCWTAEELSNVQMVVVDLATGFEMVDTCSAHVEGSQQDIGAYYTYNKRYMLTGKFNLIIEGDDNDAKGVGFNSKKSQKPELELKDSIFVTTKYVEDADQRTKALQPIKDIIASHGGGWMKEKKVWQIDKSQLSAVQDLDIVSRIVDVNGDLLPTHNAPYGAATYEDSLK